MKKEHVISLTRRVSAVAGVETPIIVGSQALYAAARSVPGAVERSTECDFLLGGAGIDALMRVRQELGVLSAFQERMGYHADALGRSSVVFPPGWEDRLQPLKDEHGHTVAFCTEIHDTCVAKLMAGRDKDWPLLIDVLASGLVSMSTLMERAALVAQLPEQAALLDRLKRFEDVLWQAREGIDRTPLRALIRQLQSPPDGRGGTGLGI